jgi:D-alanine-D-alanine ligase-like ATP-grasp enzyme
MPRRTLALIYETEAACRERLLDAGFVAERALEITSYLAQATDLAPEFGELAKECAARGVDFAPIELDAAPKALALLDPASTLVWTLTDGVAYYRGGVSPALARLYGHRTIGADDSVFALCQDKFRSGAVLSALGLPIPPAGLARDGAFVAAPPASPDGYFVKPNRLGSKIGIWPDSRCRAAGDALELSRRIFAGYRDEAIVQAYVPGRNVRASFLAVNPGAGVEKLGVFFVDAGGDFQTMADSLALYGETGAAAKAAGAYAEPELVPVSAVQPKADVAVREIAARLMAGLGLKDVYSIDLRVEADGNVHLIEFEVGPGLPCFDFRDYCRRQWNMTLAEAMASTAAGRFAE